MKKKLTVVLAAALSVAMVACMAACNNGGGQQNSGSDASGVSNPFLWSTESLVESDTQSSIVTPASSVVESSTEPVSVVSTVSDTSSEVSIVPPEISKVESSQVVSAGPASEPSVGYGSDIWDDDSDILDDDSDILDDDSDILDDDSDIWDDDSSYVYSNVEPKGGVMPEYVGTWKFEYDFSSMSPEEASYAQAIAQMLNMEIVFTLDSSGVAGMTMSMSGETSSVSDGQWSAEGDTIYITFVGETLDFHYSNGRMSAEAFDGGYFVKS